MNFTNQFIPEIEAIIRRFFLTFRIDEEEDLHYGTDLLGEFQETNKHLRFACRIRRANFLGVFNDFTIRYDRPSGLQCEYEKIMNGYGDYMVYGFGDSNSRKLLSWWIINLHVFRDTINMENRVPKIKPNADGSSRFAIFPFDEFPKNLIFAESRL